MTTRIVIPRRRQSTTLWLASNARLIGPLFALVLLIAIFTALAPGSFPTGANVTNILSQVSVLAVMAVGLTFVLLLGQIDLSVANVSSFAGVTCATFFSGNAFGLFLFGEGKFTPEVTWIAILGPVLLGILLGWGSSLMINYAGIPSFVATLAIFEIASGWALYWSQGNTLYDIPPFVAWLGAGTLGPLPVIALVAAVIMLIGHFVLQRTRFGRHVYMTGANRRAAELSGVPVKRVMRNVLMISGGLAAFAGVLNVGRLGSAQAELGNDLLLPAIAAVVLGGTSLFGGVGGMGHTMLGVLIYGVLDNGLDQLDIDIFLKPFIRGLFLILALVLNVVAMGVAARSSQARIKQINTDVASQHDPAESSSGERELVTK
jgi:ribose transport system permease protein